LVVMARDLSSKELRLTARGEDVFLLAEVDGH
jgi:hypothetical protein